MLGSVVEGRVTRVFGGAAQGVARCIAHAREEHTGRLSESMTTFTDGSFYLLGVRPGRYTLIASISGCSTCSGMRAEPRRFEIGASGDGPGAIDLLLAPRP